ncbi:MAG: DNA-directed RNA polymerase subunit alpha [Patescibacteria group bacterium]|nr:DNA-directed RNA polymerase subunit alpha [Patescibacteria group bacterium]
MIKVTLPKNPKFIQLGENSGKIEIANCYPGYGTTLGNALRRILLSSLTGAAVTSVKIKGITHEFSTIPGVLEDVIQIILNLKKVRFRMHKDEPVKLTLKESGAKKITAAQIQCPADVELVNKEAPIATITDKKGEIEMEIEVQKGLGYIPVEQQERDKKEIGLIAIDAIYTPIKRVNYAIENMRVGKRTDYDKITLEIETDGTVTAKEAFQEAVKIAISQYEAISDFEEEVVETEEEAAKEGGLDKEDAAAPKGVKDENHEKDAYLPVFSTRTSNVLEKNNIKAMKDLLALSEDELKKLEGMGDKGIKEIRKAIGNLGLTLK